MEIILLKNYEGLGEAGDVVSVKPGFARNKLIPEGVAPVSYTHLTLPTILLV